MKTNNAWKIIFCSICTEPTPPNAGMKTDHLGFICDDCMNYELSPPQPIPLRFHVPDKLD